MTRRQFPEREPGPAVVAARAEEARQKKARRVMQLAAIQRADEERRAAHAARLEREAAARRDLDEHARMLALERQHARERSGPNAWLRPGDPGFVSRDEFEIRQRLQVASRPVPVATRRARGEVDAILRRAQADIARDAASARSASAGSRRARTDPSFTEVARVAGASRRRG